MSTCAPTGLPCKYDCDSFDCDSLVCTGDEVVKVNLQRSSLPPAFRVAHRSLEVRLLDSLTCGFKWPVDVAHLA
jgi:hypothetical protein